MNCRGRTWVPGRWTDRIMSLWPPRSRLESITWLFFVCDSPFFGSSVKICTMIDDDWGVVWAIEKSVSYAYILLLLLCVLLLLCLFSLQDTVCGFTTEYLDLIDYNLYTVRCCTTYEHVFVYTCLLLCSVLLYCCYCSCCCLLLLFVIVCRMAKFVAGVHCIWFQCFFTQTRYIFNVALGSTVAFTVSFFYL